MKFIIASFLVCILCGLAAGQSGVTVTGVVTGKPIQPGNPLRIKVFLVSTTDKGISFEQTIDSRGQVRFSDVPAGEYRVFAAAFISDVILQDDHVISVKQDQANDFELNISYDPGDTILEFVNVAAGQQQQIEQVSKTVNVISAQELRDRADFSLAETLRTIPGFRIQQFGGFGRTATIKARGLRNQDTAILIDGIRFRDPSAITGDASPFLSDITLTSVSKIEVLRGSGSSLYGTNAIGGVVDLQTPRPPSGTHGQLSGAIGGLGLRRFRGNISHGTSDGKFGINAGFAQTAYTKGIDGNDNARNTNLQTRVEYSHFRGQVFPAASFYRTQK